MATTNKSAGSLVKDIFLSIVAVVIVIVVFFLFDEPTNQEDTELSSLFGLLPDGFFSGTFAPFDMVIFNIITALVIIYTIFYIIWRIISWSVSNR